ncbi:GAF domain-containing protein [Frigoribacterium sp. PhB160]|uniref:GAF and ANTAR domain-containing protein n=1 Tax=Frigoribacterium sp. PhB160 TaxID=2485192 RepID=UPI000F4754F6|nr:GAF and ANTAR domain-containing protein [Frigoribacterium sp. PhB160]ROS58036.1 GAF domain-containing protein [Frigoribacterium sp. PhB160]
MSDSTREGQLVEVFTSLADTLVADYDVVDLLQTLVDACADLFDVTAAGIILPDRDSAFEVVVSTSEASHLIEVMQLDAEQGPCMECFRTGAVVAVPDIEADADRWDDFGRVAVEQGFRAVVALPLRLRDRVIGTLNLFRDVVGDLNPRDVRAAQALADVATIGVIHERTYRETTVVQQQLQHALDSRVVIEQAKGVLSEVKRISTDDAFAVMRRWSRDHNRSLSQVAREVVARELHL